ncbi:MAG: MgtC/SapB family protein [Clostridia bacterium]|jgi:putative Mg2+ transporter-C (MgtC) family protein|nr:MgtC/SapB family protein [Clostridia bacterium]MBR0454061.1 MgtC/SapB family protein [Clostridia bacterium]
MAFWEVLLRLLVATFCGGVIGIERGKKNRPAGFRTYILVCVGASLTMILGEYLACMYSLWREQVPTLLNSDIARIGAQVINGIGFLGAGTIMITGNQQVKGMTTAAGLWASACMGLAIGSGFYAGALIGCTLIILTTAIFSKLEAFILLHSRNVNLYVEFERTEDLTKITERLRDKNVRIYDVEFVKPRQADNKYPSAIFSLQLPKKTSHASVVTEIATIDVVKKIEEL